MAVEKFLAWVSQYGYPSIFAALMFGIAGLPIPDETILTFTGYLIYKQRLHLVPALATAFAGSVCGITLSYVLGRVFGMPLIHKYGKYIHLTEERIQEVHQWFEKAGRWGLTFGYYVPGVRHFTAYAAGMSDLEPHVFALFAYSGALLWSSSFITLGYFLGERWESVSAEVHRYVLMAAGVLGGLLAIYLVIRAVRRKRAGG